MTPFEAAGYTKDTKFKLLKPFGKFQSAGVTVWLKSDDGSDCPWFTDGKSEEPLYFGGRDINLQAIVEEPVLSLDNYPNPRHKHADIIHAWAEGADVESSDNNGKSPWVSCEVPQWKSLVCYRVKPSKSQKQTEKEALQEQLAKIEQETATLKQQLSKLGE